MSRRPLSESPEIRSQSFGRKSALWAIFVLTLCIFAWVFWESQRLIRSDWLSTAARQQVVQWVARTESPKTVAEWQAAREAIESALAIVPDDPAFHEVRGDLYVVGGWSKLFDQTQQQAFFKEAIKSYQDSLHLRPTEPQTWASLASAYYGAKQYGLPLQQAWANALALGPYEGQVQPMLMDLALATWLDATPQMQQWVQDTFQRAPEASRSEINRMAEQRGLKLSIAP